MSSPRSVNALWVWVLVAILIVLHQDNWFWTDGRLVLGFLPMGLFYHACLSIAASILWFLTVKFAWPSDVEVAEPPTDATTPPIESGGAK